MNTFITSIKNKDHTVDKVYESGTTFVYNRPSKISQREKNPKPPELIIIKENLDVSLLTVLVKV